MDLSSTSQVSTLVREPVRVGDATAPVPAATAPDSGAGNPNQAVPVAAPETVQAVEEPSSPLPPIDEAAGGPGERLDIEV